MNSQPRTDQIILDCRRELLEVILPDVCSDHVRVSVQMLENVLRNVATRAAHEIAWMREETVALEVYAREVAQAFPADEGLCAALADALADLDTGPRESLHLEEVCETYSRAGRAMSCALELAMAAGQGPFADRAAELLAARNARELEIKGEWTMVGRT
jgi:hypothetical protein